MELKFLGTGTSQGIPVIGSNHPVCLSDNPKDRRLRSSVLITTSSQKKILIDCGPDFRQQMLINKEAHVDAVLLTHEHNDHVVGLDDLRPIIFNNQKKMPLFTMDRVANEIRHRFPYAFQDNPYPGIPSFDLHVVKEDFEIFGQHILPITVKHGNIDILGFKIGNLAYITDASFIAVEEKKKLKNIDILIINSLRKTPPHPTHFTLSETLDLIEELSPKKSYLTHISHHLGFHQEVESELPQNVHLAYDGLSIQF